MGLRLSIEEMICSIHLSTDSIKNPRLVDYTGDTKKTGRRLVLWDRAIVGSVTFTNSAAVNPMAKIKTKIRINMYTNTLLEMPPIPQMTDSGGPAPRLSQPTTWLLPDPETIYRQTNDLHALFNPSAWGYLILEPAARRVWEALGSGAPSVGAFTERLVSENDPKYWRTRRYVYELIMALIARGFVWMGPPPREPAPDNIVRLFENWEE